MKRLFYFVFLSVTLIVLSGCNSEAIAEYRANLQTVADDMLANAALAEEILDIYATVWSHTIQSRGAIPVSEMADVTGLSQSEIEEHFVINTLGNIPDDFSTNIYSMNSYYTSIGKLDEIQQASGDIKQRINELNEPPEGYEEVYNEVLDMYIFVEEYTELALNPTGSLQSFNDSRSQLSSDIIGKYKRIEALMPKEK